MSIREREREVARLEVVIDNNFFNISGTGSSWLTWNMVLQQFAFVVVLDMDARPWDFQAEECALRACVDRFNSRRYGTTSVTPDFEPVDNCIHSVLGQRVDLSDNFKNNYEKWLEVEVFGNPVDWEQVVCR